MAALVGRLPSDFTLLHYRSFLSGNRSFKKGILWKEGIFFILQVEALAKGVPQDRIEKIARLIRRYNRYIPEDFQVRRVLITGMKTYAAAGFDRNPPLVELGYGLVSSGSLDQVIRHEMMHAKYNSHSRPELLGWSSLFGLLRGARELQVKSEQPWKVPPHELIDDSNFYAFDSSGVALENGDFRGHPDANADEAFASAAGAFESSGDVLAGYVQHALDSESRRVGLLLWGYLRDRVFHRVFTENGQDPFAWFHPGNPLTLMPRLASGLEESEIARKPVVILGPEAVGILEMISDRWETNAQAIPVVAVVESKTQAVKVRSLILGMNLPVDSVTVIDLSRFPYDAAPYNGDAEATFRLLVRYYAGEEGESPIVARTLDDLLELVTFLGVPEAEAFSYQARWRIEADLERRNL